MVPRERTEDVIYFSPADMDYPMGLNLFEYQTADQKDFLIQEALNMLYKLYDPQHQGIMGPRYEHLFRNAALTVMADPEGGTFVDIPKLFRDPNYVKQKLQYVTDPNVLEFWQKEMPQSQRSNEFGEVVSWFVSKFGAFLSNEMMRNIIGQTKSSFDLRDIMDNKKILLVNLSKGRSGELNSKLLGMIFVMKFQAAAMSRANIPENERQDFALYVDEFQNFSTDSFATIMSEARKYHLNLIVANQFTTQLTDEIRDAVFGNMGTVVAFRVGQLDVDALSRYFQPTFEGNDLLRIPNYNTITRTLVGGVPTNPFSMATLPPLGNPNPQLAIALKQLSAAKYGKPKAVVEKEIFSRLVTQTPPPPVMNPYGPQQAGGAGFSRPPMGAGGMPGGMPMPQNPYAQQPMMQPPRTMNGPVVPPRQGKAATANGSFLDSWLSRKNAPAGARPVRPRMPAQPAQTPHTMAAGMPAPQYGGYPQLQGPPGQGMQGMPSMQPSPQSFAPPMPQRPFPAPNNRPPQQQAPRYGNISSDQFEQQEVSTIAQELKQSLKSQQQAPATTNTPQAGEIPLHNNRSIQPQSDTIFIDQEGNIQRKSE
jgi:hypothetical protein